MRFLAPNPLFAHVLQTSISPSWPLIWYVFKFLVILGIAAYWASVAFDEDRVRRRPSLLRWIQKPSTLLIVLAFGVAVYTRSVGRITEMMIVLAFVVRHWEITAFADLKNKDRTDDE